MDEELRQLFLSKSVGEDVIAAIEAKDDSLRSVDDLASGAESEADARTWAEELGLSGRVAKSRFVQSWLAARGSRLLPKSAAETQGAAVAAAAEVAAAAVAPPAGAPTARRPSAFSAALHGNGGARGPDGKKQVPFAPDARKGGELAPDVEEFDEAGWRKLEHGLFALVPSVLNGKEHFTVEGGFSDPLRTLLRAAGVTGWEVATLEHSLDVRTCADLAVLADDELEAMRIAQGAGISSKVSREKFAAAWQVCHAKWKLQGGRTAENGAGANRYMSFLHDSVLQDSDDGPADFGLFTAYARGDLEACAQHIVQKTGMQGKEELLQLLAGMLSGSVASVLRKEQKDECLSPLQRVHLRWSSMMRIFWNETYALSMLKTVREEYRSTAFQLAAESLNEHWTREVETPTLEDKVKDIEALCFTSVLTHILPRFGFEADEEGWEEMKATLDATMKNSPQVRQAQTEISSLVMSQFNL